jgi:uncharacterized protein
MPLKSLRRVLPRPRFVYQQRGLQLFAGWLGNPRIWALNRPAVAGGLSVGLFWSMMPMPFQMLPSAASALVLRVNLPAALLGVWVSNPLTMGPMMYGQYRIGLLLLGRPTAGPGFTPSVAWFFERFALIWQPLLLGAVLSGLLLAVLGYLVVSLLWRAQALARLRRRRRR